MSGAASRADNQDSLTSLYETLMQTGELPPEVWDEWLWKTDPEEAFSAEVLMNRCQLLGFLVCLCKGLEQDVDSTASYSSSRPEGQAQQAHSGDRLTLMDKPVSSMTLRELRDTISNIQIEWPVFLKRLAQNPCAQRNLDAVLTLIDQCAGRFGALCLRSYDEETLDDLESVDKETVDAETGEAKLLRVSYSCIRRTVCTFLVIYRHLHLLAVAREVPAKWCDPGITKYHMEASSDDFNLLCMHLSLPVAAKLNYKHDFAGMYNHVSQVVFFHNSEYQRIPRAPLAQLDSAGLEHVLPALMQLYPSIGLKYEEDCIDLSDSAPEGSDWYWLVLAGRVYLVDPRRAVWYSSDVTSLLGVYLEKTRTAKQRSLASQLARGLGAD